VSFAPRTALIAFAASALCGCGALLGGAQTTCSADDECPLDARCSAGKCVAIAGEGEGSHGEGEGEGAHAGEGEGASSEGEGEGASSEGEGEGTSIGEGEGEGEGGGQHCSLADGSLSATDIPVVPGLPMRFIEADSAATSDPTVPVDVDGTSSNGTTTWDFTGAHTGDAPFQMEASLLSNQWFASTFASEAPLDQAGNGAYVAPLASDTLAIFRRSQDQLVILGVASVDANYTLITYDPPILVLKFPLTEGETFQSESTGSGTFETNPFYVSTDDYVSTLDKSGKIVTNAGTYDALRLHLDQSVTVGVFTLTHIQYAWIAPCLGVVAQVTSGDGETDDHFTHASQVRRLAAPGNP
jgi:hypothetical protein